MESYHSDYGGRLERSIDGELVWLPLVKKLTKRPPGPKDPAITLPPAPQALDASTALLSGKSHGGELPKKEGKEPTGWSPVERLENNKRVRFEPSKGTTDANKESIENIELFKERDGSIGGELLNRFTIIMNYPLKKISLKK